MLADASSTRNCRPPCRTCSGVHPKADWFCMTRSTYDRPQQNSTFHSMSSFGLLLISLSLLNERVRLLLRLLLLPARPPRPPRPPFGFSFGGGRTNAKSTEIVWSRSFVLFKALMAAFASGCVGYSIRAYPYHAKQISIRLASDELTADLDVACSAI